MASFEVLEGRISVAAALLACQRRFQVILLRDGLHPDKAREIVELAEQRGVALRRAPRPELDALAHGSTHGGVLAICSAKPITPADELIDRIRRASRPALLLLLEGIDDARNLGFVIRTADAMGADAVLIKRHLWDFDAAEISRPSSGAYERMTLTRIDDLGPLRELQKIGVSVIGCLAKVKRSVYAYDWRGPSLIAIGGEKRGLSGALREICDGFVTIPTRGSPTSLSLSHAAAIGLAEAYRQRTAPFANRSDGSPA